MSKVAVIIVAGGSGKRFGNVISKQFLELKGLPILMHTLNAFEKAIEKPELILVLAEDQFSFWNKLCQKHDFLLQHTIVKGGAQRFFSVQNGLSEVSDVAEIVAVHDGVRPLVSTKLIQDCISAAEIHQTAIPVVPLTDSIRILENGGSRIADRNRLRAVQTPQCFQKDVLISAYNQSYADDFTDDASVVEKAGQSIHLCEGDSNNIKITHQKDIIIAEALM